MSNYSESYFDELQDYIAGGSKGALTTQQQAYEDVLFSASGIIRREGRQAAMAWLQADRGCSRHVAERICGEAINLFYATDHVRAEAWRNLLFEKMLTATRLWEQQHIYIEEKTGETRCIAKAKDYEAYTKIIKQAAALKRLSERDEVPAAPIVGNQQINIYGTNAQDVGMPATDKRDILNIIQRRKLPKNHQARLEMELGMEPLDIDSMLDDSIELAEEVDNG